jgi:glycosyl transferase family 25
MNHRVWMSRSKQVAGDRDLHELRSNHSGCAGYIFSLDAAKKMTDLLEMPDQAADNLMFVRAVKSGELGEIFQMTPALCIQEFVCFETHSDSDIEPERENLRSNVRKRPVFQRILREVKRPFNRVSEKTRYLSEVHRVVPFE